MTTFTGTIVSSTGRISLTSLVSRLRYRLNDNDASISSTILEQAIKDSISFVAKSTECFIKTESITASTNSIALSDIFVTIQSVKDTSGTTGVTIRPSNIREYDEMDGKIACWFIKNDALYTSKLDGSHYTNIDVTYSYIPDITTIGISEKFVPVVIAYALYRMRDSERDSSLADRAFSEFSILTGVEVVKRDETTLNLSKG